MPWRGLHQRPKPRSPSIRRIGWLLGLAALFFVCVSAHAQGSKENSEFKLAVGLFKDGMYDLASDQFKNFISAYPNTADGIEARFYLGQTQMKLKKYDEARITFQNFALAYVDHPKAPEAWFNVGEAFLALRNDREAASAFERVKVFHPKSPIVPDALLEAAEIDRRLGERESAKQALRAIIQDYPTSKSVLAARLAIGELYADEGQFDLAEQEARHVSEGDAPPAVKAAALFSLGKLQVTACQFDDASATLNTILTVHKESPAATPAAFEMGKIEAGSHRYTSAIEYFKKVASSHEADASLRARALLEIGKVYEKSGDLTSAQKSYEQLAHSSDSAFVGAALLAAGRTAYANGDYEKALSHLAGILNDASSPLKKPATILAARAMIGSRQFNEAVKYYVSYADNYPDDPRTPSSLLELADVYYTNLQDYRRASGVLDRIVEKYPRSRHVADAVIRIAECQEKLGDYDGAMKTYGDLQHQYPAHDRYADTQKRIEFLRNHYIKNRDAGMEKLARMMGESITDKSKPELALTLGEIYFNEMKDYEAAVKQYTSAIDGGIQDDKLPGASFFRVRALHLLSETDTSISSRAIASYEAFLERFPKSKWSDDASYYLYQISKADQAPNQTISTARTFLKKYPSSRYFDRVMIDLASAAFALGDTTEALQSTASVVAQTADPELAGIALVERGEALASADDDSAASNWLRAAGQTTIGPPVVQALWHLSDLYWRRKDAAACLPLVRRIAKQFYYTSFADRASSLLPEAELAGQDGDFADAIALYANRIREAESSVFHDSTDGGALFYLANAYDKKGDRQKAVKYYSEYLQTNRTGDLAGRAFYRLGALARTEGRNVSASSYFKQAAALGGTGSASRDIADLLYQTEQYPEAAKQYAQLAQSTDSAGAKQLYQSKVILATLRTNDVPEANKLVDSFEKMYGKDHPYRPEFEYEKGLYYYRKEDYATARKFFKKVGDDYEETRFGPWGYYYVAKILEVTNKLDEAAKSYGNIITKYPGSDVIPRILLSLGNMHFNAERFEDAIRYYQRITASPEKAGDILPYALNNLIEAYESTKLYDASLKTARDFIERFPNDESLIDKKIKIGTLSTKLGYYDQAVLQFQNLIGEAGSLLEAELRYNIGEAYYYKGDYQQAILEFLKVPYLVSKQGKVNWTATSFYMAGRSYEKMSKFTEAIGMYHQVIERPGIDATFKAAAKKEIDRVKLLVKKNSE